MRLAADAVQKKRCDFFLALVLFVLLACGLVVLFSVSYEYGEAKFGKDLHFIRNQLIFSGIGLFLVFLFSQINLDLLRSLILLLIFSAFLLMLLSFIPGLGVKAGGARRWIGIGGFSFQPSEYVKLVVIIYLAHFFSRKKDAGENPFRVVLPPVLVLVLFALLVYLQNDFSTAIFLLFIGFSLMFIAGMKLRYFAGFGIVSLVLIISVLAARPHRLERVLSWLDPAADPQGMGYQMEVAREAFSNGGLWGRGIGQSLTKIGAKLPEAYSDFIFAVAGEELGFLGLFFILLLFCAFAFRGFQIAGRASDDFRYYLAFGLTASIFFQAAFNMAVVSGLLPATGIPLPFFSSGGSSLVISLIMCGLLLNISRSSRLQGGSNDEV